MKRNLASLLLVGAVAICAQGGSLKYIDVGFSTQLNGIDPVYGFYGQVETRDNGDPGYYPFWKPPNESTQLILLTAASLSGINAHCLAGIYSNFESFNISGFQQCTDRNGHVQFFSFEFGANATIITAQLHRTQTVVGYFDDFHLVDTGFISTPVFDANGAVQSYNTVDYSVPGALSTMILTADEGRIAGSFETSTNHWSGFIQELNGGALTVVDYPGAAITGVTALGVKSYAGYYSSAFGAHHGFVYHSSFVPFNLSSGGTWITQILDNDNLVGYFDAGDGRYRGFICDPN